MGWKVDTADFDYFDVLDKHAVHVLVMHDGSQYEIRVSQGWFAVKEYLNNSPARYVEVSVDGTRAFASQGKI